MRCSTCKLLNTRVMLAASLILPGYLVGDHNNDFYNRPLI